VGHEVLYAEAETLCFSIANSIPPSNVLSCMLGALDSFKDGFLRLISSTVNVYFPFFSYLY
jgi:hypothetical protein